MATVKLPRLLWAVTLITALLASVFAFTPRKAGAQTGDPLCPSNYYFSAPTPGQVVVGDVDIGVLAPPSSQPRQVTLFIDGQPIEQQAIDAEVEFFEWDSSKVHNGQHVIGAVVEFSSTTSGNTTGSRCALADRTVFVQNPNPSAPGGALSVDFNYDHWTGSTNSHVPLEATVFYHTPNGEIDVTDRTQFNWTTTIGAIRSNGPDADFSSGPQPGDGRVMVKASYTPSGGTTITQQHELPVFIRHHDELNSMGYDIDGNPLDESGGESPYGDATARVDSLLGALAGDTELIRCLENAQFAALLMSFSMENFNRIAGCFESRRNIIPASLAPVKPDDLEKLPEKKDAAKIKEIKNKEGGDKQAILFSGKTLPNRSVFIYVFSEPLVIVTKANEQGDWTYELEDPLEPGEHKAYVAVEDDNGNLVRSSAFTFTAAAITPTAENPQGLSLIVQKQRRQPVTLYVAGVAAVLAVAGAIIVLAVRRQRHKVATPAESAPAQQPPAEANASETPSAPDQPKES